MPVQFLKQTEQLNGYYLIEFELDGDTNLRDDLPINLTVNLVLELDPPENPDTPLEYQLALFSQTTYAKKNHLTFLSQTGFPTADSLSGQNIIHLANKKLQNYQASPSILEYSNQTLNTFKASLPAEKTLCFLVTESALAQAFYLGKQLQNEFSMVMILESQAGFPFAVKPARFMFEDLPDEAVSMIGACPLLEDWGIPNRLCSHQGLPGCFDGDLKTFKSLWQPPEDWHLITL